MRIQCRRRTTKPTSAVIAAATLTLLFTIQNYDHIMIESFTTQQPHLLPSLFVVQNSARRKNYHRRLTNGRLDFMNDIKLYHQDVLLQNHKVDSGAVRTITSSSGSNNNNNISVKKVITNKQKVRKHNNNNISNSHRPQQQRLFFKNTNKEENEAAFVVDNDFDPVAFTTMTSSLEAMTPSSSPFDPMYDPLTDTMTGIPTNNNNDSRSNNNSNNINVNIESSSSSSLEESSSSSSSNNNINNNTESSSSSSSSSSDLFGRTEQWEPSLDPNPTAKIHTDYRPKRIILLRHGESIGNIDEQSYVHTPDWLIPLTKKGMKQANDAGRELRQLIGNDGQIVFYYSPYERTKLTLHEMLEHIDDEQIISYREEPRICEQQFGNFQNYLEVINAKKERSRFGRFFYRFPSGEAGLDVYNRISSFIATLVRDSRQFAHAGCDLNNMNIVIVTHGLSLRLFLMRWFQFSVEEFERSKNPSNANLVVLERKGTGVNKWYELRDDDWKSLQIQKPTTMLEKKNKKKNSKQNKSTKAGDGESSSSLSTKASLRSALSASSPNVNGSSSSSSSSLTE